jgi:hypothetical protein
MNAPFKLALIVGSLVLTAPQPTFANPNAPSAQWEGTWQLNMAHSKFATPGKRSETRTYRINGNKVKLTSTGTDARGKAEKFSYSAAYDGKWYPMVGNPRGDSIALTLDNPRVSKAKVRRNGVLTATASLEVSADGKHLTLNRKTLNAKKAPTVEVLAFDKVR